MHLVAAVPKNILCFLGKILGMLIYYIDMPHRRIVTRNLKFAYPEWADEEICRVSVRVFRNLGITILEILPQLLDNLNNIEMRTKMSWASLIGGLCISHTKTALAHSMSYPLTSHLEIPHGLAAGAFLPEILHFNRQKDSTGMMEEMYHKLSFYKPLDKRLDCLYQRIDLSSIFQEIHNNQPVIYLLVSEMINSSRALNSIIDVTYDDVRTILDMFFKKRARRKLQKNNPGLTGYGSL